MHVSTILLDRVVLEACSQASFKTAVSRDNDGFKHALLQQHPVLAQADHLAIHLNEQAYEYTVKMCEPVKSGVLQPSTRVIVVNRQQSAGLDGRAYADSDMLESSLTDREDAHANMANEDIWLDYDFIQQRFGVGERERAYAKEDGDENQAPPANSLKVQVEWCEDMKAPLDQLRPKIAEADNGFDRERVICAQPEVFIALGLLSGEQILVTGLDGRTRPCWLYLDPIARDAGLTVRVFAHLAFHLGYHPCISYPSPETLTLTCAGIPGSPVGVPVANAVSLARVASISSQNKLYELAFRNGLARVLQEKLPVVCVGDIISVPVNASAARVAYKSANALKLEANKGENGDVEAKMDEAQEEELRLELEGGVLSMLQCAVEDDSLAPQAHRWSYVDFKVTSMTTEVDTTPEYARIDPSVTRVVQIGLVRQLSFPRLRLHQGPLALHDELYTLFQAFFHRSHEKALDVSTRMIPTVLVHGKRGVGKRYAVSTAAACLGVHLVVVDCYDLLDEVQAKVEEGLSRRFERGASCNPAVLLLANVDALTKRGAVVEAGQEPPIIRVIRERLDWLKTRPNGDVLVVVATTEDRDKLPVELDACFLHQINAKAPDEQERLLLLTELTSTLPLADDVDLHHLATQSAALVAADLAALVRRTIQNAIKRMRCGKKTDGSEPTNKALSEAGVQITLADFDAAMLAARSVFSDMIGAPKIPKVTWDDVGGLISVKKDILETIQLPLEHPELFAGGMKKRSGVLLYGPPGTGKTLLAKAVATSCSLNFFAVKGPELLNMYIGESEANVRRVFQRARDARPCVIFFDELDSIAPKRGEKGDSGGVMDRIVSQLLAELDGMSDSGGGDVFVIGATNRPDLLDTALLRPGRFDKMIYLGISEDHESQLNILRALTRKFRLDPGLDLQRVAEQCPFNFTGADFYALCSDAMLKAMSRKAQEFEKAVEQLNMTRDVPITSKAYMDGLSSDEEFVPVVGEEDFLRAMHELVPSVSLQELAYYKQIRDKFSEKTTNGTPTTRKE